MLSVRICAILTPYCILHLASLGFAPAKPQKNDGGAGKTKMCKTVD